MGLGDMSSLKDRKAKSKSKTAVKPPSKASRAKPEPRPTPKSSVTGARAKVQAGKQTGAKPVKMAAVAKPLSRAAIASLSAKAASISASVTVQPQSGSKSGPMSTTKKPAAASTAKGGGQTAKKPEAVLPAGYKPSDAEPFMGEQQRIYFRNKLLAWKDDIVRQNRETLQGLHEDSTQHADIADRATSETDRALELRARDRQRKLIGKIDAALARIEDGSYGYCEDTGEPISLKRLDARPIATLSLEAQERHERRERVFRED
jgi:DnaK suppressor protein